MRDTKVMRNTKAMRNTIVAMSLAVWMTGGLVGCKSAPKMPWSRTARNADVASTAVAHSAPALPADIAKEAESLAAASPSIQMSPMSVAATSGGQAAPYAAPQMTSPVTPTTTPVAPQLAATPTTPLGGSGSKPTAYPTTPTPQQVASQSGTPGVLGSMNMPYDPQAVPPAKVAAAPVATAPVGGDRYAATATTATPTTSLPSAYTAAPATPAAAPVSQSPIPQLANSDRYRDFQSTRQVAEAAAPAAPTAANTAPNTVANTAPRIATPTASPDRYATSTTVAAASLPASSPVAASSGAAPSIATPSVAAPSVAASSVAMTSPVTPQAAPSPDQVVAAAPYRPGGTSSYEGGSLPAMEVATRPHLETQAPGATVPSTTPSEAPRYR